MRELEASLQAHGLLENLVVRANDGKTFQVVGGGRRLQALRALAKKRRSRFRTTTPIPCRVMPDDAIDEEISYAENAVRVNMHPVYQFTAFHTMLERGLSAREIVASHAEPQFQSCDHGRSAVLGRRPFRGPLRVPAHAAAHRHYTELRRCRHCGGVQMVNLVVRHVIIFG